MGFTRFWLKLACIVLWLGLIPVAGYTQCNKGLGVPIVEETFGAGTSPYGRALPAGVTNLFYEQTQCPNDGEYAILNYTTNCFGSTWHTVTDHTGDQNGYFMAINASETPNTFYTHTIDGLCPGTTFEFSAWIVNLDSLAGLILPNVTFTIEKTDGTVLSTYNTGDIPESYGQAQWVKYGFDFTTPVGISTVVISMRNNAPGGDGNDLGLDDIAFTPTGPSVELHISGSARDTLKIPCNNNSVLSATIGSCYVQNTYQWQTSTDGVSWADIPAATGATYNLGSLAAGTSFFRLGVAENGNIGNANCRAVSNVVMIDNAEFVTPTYQNVSASICTGPYTLPSGKTVNASGVYVDNLLSRSGCDSLITTVALTIAPQPNLGQSRLICPGDTITLNPGTFNSYKWQDGSTNPTYTVTTAGIYSVTVTDSSGCSINGSVQIKPGFCGANPIPNAFTPNGDGINDTWNIPQLLYYPACTVLIYNRWGKLVFNSTGYSRQWDGTYNGKALPTGTYYYKITLQPDGEVFSGFVALLR